MKLSKEELKQKIDTLDLTDDLKITLLEDIEDSFPSDEITAQMEAQYQTDKANLEAQIANEKAYIEELKAKYKERFLKGDDKPEDKSEPEEVKEEEVIDIKEI